MLQPMRKLQICFVIGKNQNDSAMCVCVCVLAHYTLKYNLRYQPFAAWASTILFSANLSPFRKLLSQCPKQYKVFLDFCFSLIHFIFEASFEEKRSRNHCLNQWAFFAAAAATIHLVAISTLLIMMEADRCTKTSLRRVGSESFPKHKTIEPSDRISEFTGNSFTNY